MIAIASDHGGYELKTKVVEKLKSDGYEINDLGTYSEESVDYPNYGKLCGEEVASGKAEKGIVICGSGIGISIAANKVKGIRCALCTSEIMAELAAKHNNANMLGLGGRVKEKELEFRIIDKWVETEFEGGRHERRIDLLNNM